VKDVLSRKNIQKRPKTPKNWPAAGIQEASEMKKQKGQHDNEISTRHAAGTWQHHRTGVESDD